jgi:hypothetical protein
LFETKNINPSASASMSGTRGLKGSLKRAATSMKVRCAAACTTGGRHHDMELYAVLKHDVLGQ